MIRKMLNPNSIRWKAINQYASGRNYKPTISEEKVVTVLPL